MEDSTSAAPPVSPIVPPLWLKEDNNDYDDEMAEISAEMPRLDDEEKNLARREKLQTMRQELAAKRQRVSDLKGTKDSKSKC